MRRLGPPARSPLAELRRALEHLHAALDRDLDPMARTMAQGVVAYALGQAALVQEIKRPRRAGVQAAPPSPEA